MTRHDSLIKRLHELQVPIGRTTQSGQLLCSAEERWLTLPEPADPKAQPFKRFGDKIGRNDPCPCGSGKKYKQCHGKLA